MSGSLPTEVARGIYQVSLGFVNVLLVEDDDGGLWLVDAGVEPGAERIGGAIRSLGRAPRELRGVVVTHLHPDHVGGLEAVKSHTGADVWMGAEDAALVRAGRRGRELEPGPGPVRTLIVRVMGDRTLREHDPVVVEHEIHDGDALPLGAVAVHTPGHTAGHTALLWRRDGGVLFAGDAATNFVRLGVGPIYEDVGEGLQSLRRLAGLEFETALFAHGRPLTPHASERFRARFGA